MAALDFLRRNHKVTVLHFDHGTSFGEHARLVVEDYCRKHDLDIRIGEISRGKGSRESLEEYWRRERYDWLDLFKDRQCVTAHTLNDQVETWIWSSLHGTPKLIPITREHYIRPFSATKKTKLFAWAVDHGVHWMEDPSNQDCALTRAYIRHTLLPHALNVNPGIYKTIRRKVLNVV